MKRTKSILAVTLVFLFAAAAQAAPFKMRIAHQMPESHFLADEVKDFKKLVEEKTGGKLVVEIYPSAQAFKPKEVIGAVVTGTIEAGMTTNFEWAGMIAAMDTFIVPFLVTEVEVIEKAVNGEVGDRLSKMMQSKGVMPLMWLLQTRTNLYSSNEKLLLLPADFKGKKMRGTSKIMNLGSEALGAATMPVSGPEVYQALQRGTLDIGLTGVDAAYARHIYEVQKYGTVANTFSVVHPVIVNPAFWSSLPPDLQTAVREAARIVQKKAFADSEKAKETAIRELGKKMTVHIQTKQEEDAWRAAMMKPVLDHFLERTGKDGAELVELIRKIKR